MNNNKGFTLVELLAVIVVLAIIALIGYTIVGDVISGAQESADKENVREYARSVRLAITSAQMNGETIPSPLDNSWLTTHVEKTGNEVVCSSVIDNNGTITLSGCSVGGSVQKYCYDGSNVTTCTRSNDNTVKIYGTENENFYNAEANKSKNLFNNYGYSARGLTSPSATRYLENTYGTKISTIEPSNTLEVVQSIVETAETGTYKYGYFLIGVTGLEVDKKYTISFDMQNTNNQLNTKEIYLGPNGSTESNIVDFSLSRPSFTFTYRLMSNYESRSYIEIRNNGISFTMSNIQIELGDTATTYEPYGYKIPITAKDENSNEQTITIYIGSEKLGADDYLSYNGSDWKIVRNGTSSDPVKVKTEGATLTGTVTYSVSGLPDSNFVYNYE